MGSVSDLTAAVWRWNDSVPSCIEECAHELIHKQVKLHPNTLAVDAHDGALTYAELDEAANRVAHYLVNLGVGPESVVPLCFEKRHHLWVLAGLDGVNGSAPLLNARNGSGQLRECESMPSRAKTLDITHKSACSRHDGI